MDWRLVKKNSEFLLKRYSSHVFLLCQFACYCDVVVVLFFFSCCCLIGLGRGWRDCRVLLFVPFFFRVLCCWFVGRSSRIFIVVKTCFTVDKVFLDGGTLEWIEMEWIVS